MRKFSQRKLADILGISRSYVSMYETGYIKPDIAYLVKVAKALDCKPIDLIGNIG